MSKSEEESKICFVIAPIGEPDSEIRKRSDQVLKHIIQPAAQDCGYEAVRADQISEPGIITSQVIQHVVNDPMLVADLTGRNPNVFYELAIRHAIKKPMVQMIRKGDQMPFDVAGTRTVQVDIHDLDSVEGAKNELGQQMRSFEKGATEVDSPISVALDLQVLRDSGQPEQIQLADMISTISEIRSSLALMENRLGDPTSILPPGYVREVFGASPRISREIVYELHSAARMLRHELGGVDSEPGLKAFDVAERLLYLVERLRMDIDSTDELIRVRRRAQKQERS